MQNYNKNFQKNVQNGFADANQIVPTIGEVVGYNIPYWDWNALASLGSIAGDRYVVRGLLEMGAITWLYGAGGVGKSWLALDIGLHVASGASHWLGFPIVCTGPVLYVDADNAGRPVEVRRRIDALVYDWSQERPFYVIIADTLWGNSEVLHDVTERISAKLIIIDTFQALFADDPNDAGKITQFRNKLLELAEKNNAAILVCDHVTKSDARANSDDGLAYGSVFKMNFARIAVLVRSVNDDDDTLELKLIKNNNMEEEARWYCRTIVRRSENGRVYHENAPDAGVSGEIIQVLQANVPLTAKDIQRRLEDRGVVVAERSVRAHLKELRSQGYVSCEGGRGKRTNYRLISGGLKYE